MRLLPQLGTGTTTNVQSYPSSDTLAGVASASAGGAHTCAVMAATGAFTSLKLSCVLEAQCVFCSSVQHVFRYLEWQLLPDSLSAGKVVDGAYLLRFKPHSARSPLFIRYFFTILFVGISAEQILTHERFANGLGACLVSVGILSHRIVYHDI